MKHYRSIGILLFALLVCSAYAQDGTEYDKFIAKARDNFGVKAEKLNKKYRLGAFSRWDYMQEEGQATLFE